MRASLAALIFLAAPAPADRLDLIGAIDWEAPVAQGMSGLEVGADGTDFVAVSDKGWRVSGSFAREDGRIVGIEIDRYDPILDHKGLPAAARRAGDWSDAEGLAVAPDGTEWISFERWAHVWRYDEPGGRARLIRDHPDFYGWRDNRQLEALAIAPDGTLWTFPENPEAGEFPAYRLERGEWMRDGALPASDFFQLVGADFAPDGRLWILERKLSLGIWWQNRIRRVDMETREAETMWTGRRGEFLNLEGIAVWEDAEGLRITVVSDNNTSPREVTQFVEFRLTE